MKRILFILLSSLVGSLLLSCEDDSVAPGDVPGPFDPIVISFEASEHTAAEDSGENSISILLSRPSTFDSATVTVLVESLNMNDFTTNPTVEKGKIQLLIAKGADRISMKVTPVNNQLLDGDKQVIFKIESTSNGFSVGPVKQSILNITDNEGVALVNFSATHSSTEEDKQEGELISIELSEASPGNGLLEISVESGDADYGVHYTTFPTANMGKISIPVNTGTEQIQLKIIPVNNDRIDGNRHIALAISNVSGMIRKGSITGHSIDIGDDELRDISKSYSISGGGWSYKKYFGYSETGMLSKVYWEQYTPGYSGGNHVYQYDGNGQLKKMIESGQSETIYTTESGRIVKAEKFKDGIQKQYTLYGYDAAGNVGEASVYYRQPSGELKLGLIFVYLYFQDGNMYKQLTYDPNDGNEPELISTRTYEDYLPVQNPFPMVEVLPNKSSQLNLPGSYRIEENGSDIRYDFRYEFDGEGRVRKRTATASNGSIEVAAYAYY